MSSSRLSIHSLRELISRQRRDNIESSILDMKRAQKIKVLALGVFYTFGIGLLNVGLTQADTKPYFQVHGGDIFAGGWWYVKDASNNYNCDTDEVAPAVFQSPTFSSATVITPYEGGILSFNNFSGGTARGALGDYGVFALGQVEGESGHGFASNKGNGMNALTFANAPGNNKGQGAAYWGGFFNTGPRQLGHCIADYYNLKVSGATDVGNINLGTVASGKYKANASPVFTINSATIPSAGAPGKTITLLVDGDTYITGNIVYGGGYNADSVTKFTLVVRGSLYIDKAVSRLDGFYIVQPNMSKSNPVTDDTGILWTCSTATANGPTNLYINRECKGSSLTVNGAVIAKQANLLRVAGDVTNGTVAESFNYTPELIMGGSNFYGDTDTDPHIDSLIVLPPVF